MSTRSVSVVSLSDRSRWRAIAFIPAFVAFAVAACSGSGDAGLTPTLTCSSNAECGPSQECSGNGCVNFVSCDTAATCALGQNCIAHVCRATCGSDAQCAPLKLSCDLTSGVCLPSNSSSPSSGGSGGETNDAGSSGAAGSGSAGGTNGGASSLGGMSGTGGVLTGGSSSSGGTGDAPPPPSATTDLIDDLEDGDQSILETAGRTGKWYFYNASGNNAGGSINQVMNTSYAGANGSKYSVETQGGPLSSDGAQAYAGLAVDFDNQGNTPTDPSRKPYDLSGWDGISFWAKSNSADTTPIRVNLATLAVVTPEQQGQCMDGSACFDSYGKDLELNTAWTHYEIAFADLGQQGWGAAKPLDLPGALGLAFQYGTPSGSFDFAIDDVALFRAGSPAK